MATRPKRPNKLVDKIIATNRARARKDIKQWRTALQQAENTENPRRTLLYNLYDELVLDAHLSAEIQKRVLAVTGSKFAVYNEDTGDEDQDKTDLFERPWFNKLLMLAMDSRFWGHSLAQVYMNETGEEIEDLQLILRPHVIPEKGMFIPRISDQKGILYREDKQYHNWLLEIGENDDLGLLNKAAPHVLYKRFAQGAWSEFCEVFGMPLRYAKTNVKDTESLNRMEQMMINMGTASYAVIDDDEEINFVETAKSNGEVYQGLMNKSNNEISKLINGAVIGEDSKNGSRSKEEVGERTLNMISEADKQWLEGYINYTLIPRLIFYGYPLEGFKFRFEQSKNIKELWTMAQGIMNHYDVDEEWISQTFGIPVTGKKMNPTPQPTKLNEDGDFFA